MNRAFSFSSCVPFWLAATLLLFLPLLFIPTPMFFGNWDAVFYSNIMSMVSGEIQAGHFYPRWLPEANAGFGSPVMLFYAPLAYLLTAVLEWPLVVLHPSLETQFVLGIAVTQALSGLTAWAWLKENFTPRIALIGSLAFVLLPYKFIYIYEHFNLAQLWALAFLPLWLWAAEKIAQGNGLKAAALYALMLAAVYYTHPLTVIAFGGVPALYVLWFAKPSQRMRIYGYLICAHVLAAGMCLMQAFPQLYYRGWIHEEGFLTGRLDWRNNLYHIDIFLCAYYGIIAALIAYGMKRLSLPQASRSLFWACAIGVVAFMNLPVSSFLWEWVPVLKFLQFPAGRLHAIALMGTVYLLCVWLTHYRQMQALAPLAYSRLTLALLVAVFSVATLGRVYYVYSTAADLDTDYIDAVHAARIIIPPEYVTHWGCVSPSDALGLFHQRRIPEAIAGQESQVVISVESWQPPGRIRFTAEVTSSSADVTVRQCYFPLWQAKDEGLPVELSATPPYGLLRLTLAHGIHHVEIHWQDTLWQKRMRWMSLLSLLISMVLIIPFNRKV